MPLRWTRFLPALPYPHFMAFAPLDTWARLLFAGSAKGGPPRVPVRYWLRVAGGLFTSAIGTAVTLPERLVLAPILAAKFRARHAPSAGTTTATDLHSTSRDASAPAVVFILGYYRSGTTHLHYLLSCDPQFVTPRWYQVLAPQGFALSWTFLRYFLVPFLSSKRPQDDVAYGPEYPSEDDFALCNWSLAGTMPGRMVLPREWDGERGWARWNDLRALSEAERDRFRRGLWTFAWKLRTLSKGRKVLFKTPSHTARVAELASLFQGRARFIHISRPPAPVLASNIAMHRRFEPFLLQDHPGDEVIRERVIEEYDATERAFLSQSAAEPGQHVARMRYQDLIADPISEVKRLYVELGLVLSAEAERRMGTYLESVRDYRAASQSLEDSRRPGTPRWSGSLSRTHDVFLPQQLVWMVGAFSHDDPAVVAPVPPSMSMPLMNASGSESRTTWESRTTLKSQAASGYCAALLLTLLWLCLWPLVAYLAHNRNDWLIWPASISIGLAALRVGKRGSLNLGLWVAALVFSLFIARAWPATFASEPRYHHPSPDRWHHVWLSTRAGALAINNLWWVGLAAMTAFRFASRQHVRPPGM